MDFVTKRLDNRTPVKIIGQWLTLRIDFEVINPYNSLDTTHQEQRYGSKYTHL
jgi:hypothetical protein